MKAVKIDRLDIVNFFNFGIRNTKTSFLFLCKHFLALTQKTEAEKPKRGVDLL